MDFGLSLNDKRQAVARAAVRAILQQGQNLRLVVTSGSMRPLFRKEDWVTVQAVSGLGPRPGDVVLLLVGEQLISHRVISVTDGAIHTKGDASPAADPPVQPSQVLGIVHTVTRRSKKIEMCRPVWRIVSFVLAVLGRLEDALWRWFHPMGLAKGLQKILDMINWLLCLPVRISARLAVYLALWIDPS